jgi:hypothetical protein
MGAANYRVVPAPDGFCVEHEGKRSVAYATREAAFEAAVGPASNAIKEGHDVVIEIPRTGERGTRANN